MSLARRVFDRMLARLDPPVMAAVGSVLLSARNRGRCVERHDDGDWIHRYREGVVVDTRLGRPSAEM